MVMLDTGLHIHMIDKTKPITAIKCTAVIVYNDRAGPKLYIV